MDREPGEEFTEEDIPMSPSGAGPEVVQDIGGVEHRLYRVSCSDGSTQDRWVRVGVSVDDLIPAIRDQASGLITVPVPSVNPPAPVGGIVNVGLWLAIEEQSVPSLSAEAGGVWIELSPRLASTRFDFGNGDSIECDGVGVPIEEVHPDLEVVEESPWCGYTYRQSSPEDDPYELTVTAVWELPYASSSGPGSLAPMERPLTVAYDVDEIQTVGVSN